MEWVETTGKSVSDAKESALDRLGVHEDDAEFEVITEEKIGLFGRVKQDARVRVRVRPTTPRAKEDRGNRRAKQSRRAGQNQPAKANSGNRNGKNRNRSNQGPETKKNQKQEKPVQEETTMPLPEQADLAQEFVAGLAERFAAPVSFEHEQLSDNEIRLTVNGENLGRMIGQRGAVAKAIDELVRTVLQRQAGSARDGRIRVDIGGVRARWTEALVKFCRQQAEAVRESGVSRSLEPMGGVDRKIVHDTISLEAGVDTLSKGEDPNRYVVIVPAQDAA